MQQKEKQLRYLKALAATESPHFKVDCLIATAQLPLLRLRYGDLQVDVTMGDESCLALDRAIAELLRRASSAGLLVRLVKAFVKAQEVVDAYGGCLNSVAWVFLCISFLQLQNSLPGYDEATHCLSLQSPFSARRGRS